LSEFGHGRAADFRRKLGQAASSVDEKAKSRFHIETKQQGK
jgi:hypothetical protein